MTETKQAPALIQKDITDQVNAKLSGLQQDGLVLPPNYVPANALKSAFFKLQETKDRNKRHALEVCTRESIANALLDMTTQGLSPAKTQCYFIVYGDQVQLNRSYFGTQAVLKRISGVKDVWANIIYDGDDFATGFDKGREVIIKHDTKFENRDNTIRGAYCIIERDDGTQVLTTMTKKEIDQSWSKAKTGAVQKEFPQEMAKRTVINRAAKSFINTSDDSDMLTDAYNRTTRDEYEDDPNTIKEAEAISEVIEEANTELFETEMVDVPKDKKPKKEIKKPLKEAVTGAGDIPFDIDEGDVPY